MFIVTGVVPLQVMIIAYTRMVSRRCSCPQRAQARRDVFARHALRLLKCVTRHRKLSEAVEYVDWVVRRCTCNAHFREEGRRCDGRDVPGCMDEREALSDLCNRFAECSFPLALSGHRVDCVASYSYSCDIQHVGRLVDLVLH